MTARESQDELIVHDVHLDGGGASAGRAEEPFLHQGSGSAFESRPTELVCVSTTEAGLQQGLYPKVEQLVGRGFHQVVVSLRGLDDLGNDSIKQLIRAGNYLEKWGGTLRLCDVAPGLRHKLGALGLSDSVPLLADRQAAVASYLSELSAANGGGALDAGASQDLLTSSADDLGEGPLRLEDVLGPASAPARPRAEAGAPASDDPNFWGWGPAEDDPAAGLPRVDVAELLIEDAELGRLERQVDAILKRGKRYVTLRMHFQRRMRSEDVDVLTRARDLVQQQGGQMALAALQQDVHSWLKLLEFDREFLICDTADEAEVAHRRHAAGLNGGPAAHAAAARPESRPVAPAFVLVGDDPAEIVVRPGRNRDRSGLARTTQQVRVLVVAPEGLAGVPARVGQLARADAAAPIWIELGRFEAPRGERFEPLAEAVQAARRASARLALVSVSRELRAYLKILGVPPEDVFETAGAAALRYAEQRHALSPFDELALELYPEELSSAPDLEPVSSVTFESADELSFAAPATTATPSAELEQLRRRLAGAEAEAERAREEADRERRAREEAERRAQELDAASRREERRLLEIEQAKERAERRLTEAESGKLAAKSETQRLSAEVRSLRRELDLAREQVTTSGDVEKRVQELEQRLAEREARLDEARGAAERLAELTRQLEESQRQADELRQLREDDRTQIEELEEELTEARKAAARGGKSAPTAGGGSAEAAELQRRVDELERDKAKILTEAEQEIERLMREQEMLREELESAGEMIERLGKELELS